MLREAQNIDLYRDSRTTSGPKADFGNHCSTIKWYTMLHAFSPIRGSPVSLSLSLKNTQAHTQSHFFIKMTHSHTQSLIYAHIHTLSHTHYTYLLFHSEVQLNRKTEGTCCMPAIVWTVLGGPQKTKKSFLVSNRVHPTTFSQHTSTCKTSSRNFCAFARKGGKEISSKIQILHLHSNFALGLLSWGVSLSAKHWYWQWISVSRWSTLFDKRRTSAHSPNKTTIS